MFQVEGNQEYFAYKYFIFVIAGLLLIQRHPQDEIIDYNQKVTFQCVVNGSNNLLTVTWERNGKQYNSGNVENTVHNNGVSSNLTINMATVRDSGKYRCRATNVNGNSTVSTEAELISKLFYILH